jgi:hypothetical protein
VSRVEELMAQRGEEEAEAYDDDVVAPARCGELMVTTASPSTALD